MLILSEDKVHVDDLEPRDVPEEHVSFADVRGARKISHDARYAGKTRLERRIEEFATISKNTVGR